MRSSCSLIVVSALLLVLLAGGQCYGAMAIEFDSASSAGGGGSATISWSHTVGSGEYRMLVVGAAIEDDQTPDVAIVSVKYGGVNMLEVAGASEDIIKEGGTTHMKTDLYYLPSPAVGTATVEVTYSGSIGAMAAGAVSLFNVRQEAAEAAATNSAETNPLTSISTIITTVTDGAWVVDVIGSGNSPTTFNPTGGMTEMWDLANSGSATMQCAGSRKLVAGAGATTISWSCSGANRVAHSVAAFGPADSDSDMDGDGRVDEVDLGMMAEDWLGGSGLADLDGSGDVEFGDFAILGADWYMGYGSLRVTIEPAGAVSLGAKWRLAGGAWRDSAAVVSGLEVGQYTVEFSGGIAGYNPPANKQVQIVSRQLTAVTGTYTTYSGSVQVTIEPAGARLAGAQWRVDSLAWRNSGEVQSGVSLGSHTVEFKDIYGWYTPGSQGMEVYNQQTTQTSGTYTVQTGSLRVYIEPEGARTAGAQWRVDGGTWRNSGYTQTGVSVGWHVVEYSEETAWVEPDDKFVEVFNGQRTDVTGTYEVPVFTSLIISEFMASNSTAILDGDGKSSDWIEIYNPTGVSVSLGGWYLTDNADNLTKWAFPNINILSHHYLLVFASNESEADYQDSGGYYHTNFGLDSDGEYLALVQMVGGTPTVVHEYAVYEYAPGKFGYPPQQADVSYGILDDHERYFTPATPGVVNVNSYAGVVSDTKFSHDRGFYYNDFYVTITSGTPGAQVYYTLNGSEPTQSSTPYGGPIHITTTTCLRARAYLNGWIPTNVDTQTYIFINDVINQPEDPVMADGTALPLVWQEEGGAYIDADYGMKQAIVAAHIDTIKDSLRGLPTLSIVMDIDDLFDRYEGIYSNPQRPILKPVPEDGMLWERPCSVELINPDGTSGFQENCGIRIQGQITRAPGNKKHSLRLLFKSMYGASKLEYPLIPEAGAERFDTVTLRSCVYDSMMVRDEWGRRTQNIMSPPSAVGTFMHVYINGLYWGVYNPIERPDNSFSAEYLGGDKEDWDVIKRDYNELTGYDVDGEMTTWNQVLSIAGGDLSNMTNYNNLKAKMDVENLTSHMLMGYYSGNADWPGNNWIVARRRVDDYGDPWTGVGFKSYAWDVEAAMLLGGDLYMDRTETQDATGSVWCPASVDWQASYNREYCMLWADTIHKHMFNDGLLVEENANTLFLEICAELEPGVAALASRWGSPPRA